VYRAEARYGVFEESAVSPGVAVQERLNEELALLRQRYPQLQYSPEQRWVCVPSYPLPKGWNREMTDTAFQVPIGYPGSPPYGVWTLAGLLFHGQQPDNYAPGDPQPPFGGVWWRFSWSSVDAWQPSAEIIAGSNLVTWVIGFADRFRDGK